MPGLGLVATLTFFVLPAPDEPRSRSQEPCFCLAYVELGFEPSADCS